MSVNTMVSIGLVFIFTGATLFDMTQLNNIASASMMCGMGFIVTAMVLSVWRGKW